ncbi:hypothetical protein BCR36DRAFT_412082 [Piromyces finnis]|uniref:Uncharacterized protein n=1 Tax=Piromyces finnis TaxID=1754191 RepID=A0A1Y1VB42_9FUNG|nr:hypothetical protein BCR36DRAFT_412082 [Piromyces finnis]|eukprot:ORX51101.1 hypothetical protein BCR36DRAFT_412082 [Piromyces finnis]
MTIQEIHNNLLENIKLCKNLIDILLQIYCECEYRNLNLNIIILLNTCKTLFEEAISSPNLYFNSSEKLKRIQINCNKLNNISNSLVYFNSNTNHFTIYSELIKSLDIVIVYANYLFEWIKMIEKILCNTINNRVQYSNINNRVHYLSAIFYQKRFANRNETKNNLIKIWNEYNRKRIRENENIGYRRLVFNDEDKEENFVRCSFLCGISFQNPKTYLVKVGCLSLSDNTFEKIKTIFERINNASNSEAICDMGLELTEVEIKDFKIEVSLETNNKKHNIYSLVIIDQSVILSSIFFTPFSKKQLMQRREKNSDCYLIKQLSDTNKDPYDLPYYMNGMFTNGSLNDTFTFPLIMYDNSNLLNKKKNS